MTDQSVYSFGSFQLDVSEQRLCYAGQPVPLSRKSWQVLLLLVSRSPHLVTKDEFFGHIWGEVCVEEQSLTVYISSLRSLFRNLAPDERFIETVPKAGYRFAASVAVGVGATEGVPARAVKPSLAVLPFRNCCARTKEAATNVGMADALITRLSGYPQLVVRPTSAVLKYATPDLDARQAGAELGVDYVLSGILRCVEERLCVSVQLEGIRPHATHWATLLELTGASLLAAEEMVAQNVCEAVALVVRQLGG